MTTVAEICNLIDSREDELVHVDGLIVGAFVGNSFAFVEGCDDVSSEAVDSFSHHDGAWRIVTRRTT